MSIQFGKVRIIIVGDSGVGKTCLAHLIAHNESLTDPGWTVGCNIEVKLHHYKENMQQQQLYAIELFDIGGSLNHKNTRGVFYTTIHGIILVHDLTNRKSHENLREWLHGIISKEGKDTFKHGRSEVPLISNSLRNESCTSDLSTFDPEEFLGSLQVPLLVVGTKLDLLDKKDQPSSAPKVGGIAEQCSAEEIWLNCHEVRCLAAGSTDNMKLTRFLDLVIEKQSQPRDSSYYASGVGSAERRRYYTPTATPPQNKKVSSPLVDNGTASCKLSI